jgi:hypothetical protein
MTIGRMRLSVLLAFLCACSGNLSSGTHFVRGAEPEPDSGAIRQDRASAKRHDIDPELLEKVRPLYPHVLLERVQPGPEESGRPFFSRVQELARVGISDGKERLVVVVGWAIPMAYVDRGGGELLIYADSADESPLVRKSLLSIGSFSRGLVHNRWLEFGGGQILLSLADDEALEHFGRQGCGALILGLAREAARQALEVYVIEGREAFVQLAPIRSKREPWRTRHLPERISRFELYPSLVEESRYSFFKYYDSWEATVLVRLTPTETPEQPIVLELGARGLTGGIDVPDVQLLVYETRTEEPQDRPKLERKLAD